MGSSGEYAQAFKDLRDGVLLLLISFIIALVIIVAFIVAFFATIFGIATAPFAPSRSLLELLATFGSAFIALVAGGLVCLVISLIGIYAKLLPGIKRLARLDPEYSTPLRS